MMKLYCDCCKREIDTIEPNYSIEIKKYNTMEIILGDVCEDCFRRFTNIIENAEKWRKTDN